MAAFVPFRAALLLRLLRLTRLFIFLSPLPVFFNKPVILVAENQLGLLAFICMLIRATWFVFIIILAPKPRRMKRHTRAKMRMLYTLSRNHASHAQRERGQERKAEKEREHKCMYRQHAGKPKFQ